MLLMHGEVRSYEGGKCHSGQRNSGVGMNEALGKLSFPLNSIDFMDIFTMNEHYFVIKEQYFKKKAAKETVESA